MASSSQPSLGDIAQKLFQDCLHNVIHDMILQQHRDHKLMLQALDPTTKLLLCSTCKLPRLLEPPLAPKVRGAGSEPPRDTQYCERRPWSRRPGHDIYDNPFPKADATGRPPTKKEREAAAAKNKKGSSKDNDVEGTPASEEANQNGTGPPSPSENGEANDKKLEKGEKKANKIDEKLKKGEYVPWHTCPSCKRSLLITRFAKHLEQCMGLSGRQASRNAMAKMSGSSGTPAPGSRAGTPGVSQEAGGKDSGNGGEDDDDDIAVKGPGGVRKKLLKKGLNNKLKKSRQESGTSTPGGGANTGKVPKGLAAKRPPGSGSGSQHQRAISPAPSSATAAEKRALDEMLLGDEGDDEENTVHVKKRQKLSRVGSMASIGSQSTAAAPAMMERGESLDGDGSFVDDASVADD